MSLPKSDPGKASDLAMDFHNLIQDVFREGDSLEAFYERWLELSEKAMRSFTGSPQSYDTISEFIERNTEFIKSTKELYQSLS